VDNWTLQAGERVSYVDQVGFKVKNASGLDKTAADTRPISNANTADVTANAADTYLTGSSLTVGGRLVAGSFFKWRLRMTKTGAGVATPTLTVRVGTAGTTADGSRATVTFAAQTANSDTGMIEADAIFRTVGSTATVQLIARLTHTGTTTGFAASAQEQNVSNLGASFDVTSSSNIIGLSCNPGTSGVWTFQIVSIEANGLLP